MGNDKKRRALKKQVKRSRLYLSADAALKAAPALAARAAITAKLTDFRSDLLRDKYSRTGPT